MKAVEKVPQSILRTVLSGNGMFLACAVGQAEYGGSVVYADACHRTKPDERTVVLAAVIIGTLHERALRKDVAHFQISAYGSMQVAKHCTADRLIIILFHCFLY
ncbi:hypothetical protein HMPREF9445_03326 [Bacteroides clarus YIT 12056]|uniref:Uncharacterized protein n=1 Tax=Bacteroides clarus YIT 12056 TaxID=762984 RepID=A0ABN0CJ87_9BACE|nr:hypothetical protein HMPREF9445_03326 [Bacteroides clarus YIT 12056]